ncbi:MAG: glutamate 5-kinase [Syntrophomonadaceae bacterium]|jgi:glutamate 5-kinase|nr:glutamate 5-kinase [Syntrophomonadaceae bacterium]
MSGSRKWNQINRIVIKVGTSTLTNPNGELNFEHIKNLLRELSYWHDQGKDIILVSSGAVAVGAHRMRFSQVPRTMPEKQALAAIGQGELINLYEEMFAEYQKVIAQVLLTRGDFDHRLSYLNATNALLAILNLNVIPIINENDTVSTVEIKFGDNDTLSAMVASMLNADMLIVLSDVDGLYDCDPRLNKDARLLTEVENITAEMENNSLNRGSSFSSGGMFTKLKAARICMSYGAPMIIANNATENIISRLLNGEILGTLFIPRCEKMQARKKWIAFGRLPQGAVVVDAGAESALTNGGKSLLPSGIIKVTGDFDRGAVVSVENAQGHEIARGITNYSSHETKLIAGSQSGDIEKILSEKDYDEVIHRNNLWVEKS